MATNGANARLTLHVFGGCKGESIVLELPDGKWGLVDCYLESPSQPDQCALWRFLIDRGITHLEFVCLTHPHDDHYRGMSHVLQNLKVRSFWRSAAMSGSQLKSIVKLSKADAENLGEDGSELFDLCRIVKEQRKRRAEPLIVKDLSLGTSVYPILLDSDSLVSMEAIAPSGESKSRYEEKLARCFDENWRLQEDIDQGHHNLASIGLIVKFGETQIVLGGDVETNGWQDVLDQYGASRLRFSAVKVSHHGSTNGYCAELWEAFSGGSLPDSIVTAYRQHRLPRQTAMRHFEGFCRRILTPHVPGIHPAEVPIPLSVHASVKSRMALAKHFHARRLTESELNGGRCSLTFDAYGNCVDTTLSPSAAVIWERSATS